MEPCIVVESTVNQSEDDTTIIRVALSREIHGLCLYVWVVEQIIDSNGFTSNGFTSNGFTFAFFESDPKCKKDWLFKNISD